MPDTWQSIEQAAVTLGYSVRTINRHISAGKIASRLTPDGRREVLVRHDAGVSDGPFADGDILSARIDLNTRPPSVNEGFATQPTQTLNGRPEPSQRASQQAAPVPAELPTSVARSDKPSQFDSETLLVLADAAADKMERAIGAYQALARTATQQAEARRRGVRIAWSAVGAMAAVTAIAIAFTTYALSTSKLQKQHLEREVSSLNTTVSTLNEQQTKLREEARAAQSEAASKRGELDGYLRAQTAASRLPAAVQPTTQPTWAMKFLETWGGH